MESLKKSITVEEQLVFIKFGVILSHSSDVIHSNLIKSCGKNAFSLSNVKFWMKKFKDGETSTKDNRGGDFSDHEKKDEVVAQIKDLMAESRQWTTRQISHMIDVAQSTVVVYLRDELKMVKKLGKWIPHELTETQQKNRVLSCKLNLNELSKHPKSLLKTITIDETWVSLYMEPQRDQNRHWLKEGEKLPKAVSQSLHGRKRMLILAMDYYGIAFFHLYEVGETVTAERYIQFLNDKIPGWLDGKPFSRPKLLHDNARPHKAKIVSEFLNEKQITLWDHPAYSPDISPCDFNCFGQLKRKLRGVDHGDWQNFSENLKKAVVELNEEAKMRGIRSLPERWQMVIDAEGDYI